MVKNLPANAGNAGDPSGRSPGEGNGNPLWYSCHGKSHGQRSLAGRVRHDLAAEHTHRLLVTLYGAHRPRMEVGKEENGSHCSLSSQTSSPHQL